MTTKFISLVSAIVTLDVFLRSQLSSNDPLFLFASSSLPVNLGLVVLAFLGVAVSFMPKFRKWLWYAGCVLLAVVLGALGVIGAFFSGLFYSFPNLLLPLDYLFILETAIVLAISALAYEHEPSPYRGRFPKLPRVAFPVPRIPHSPISLIRNFSLRRPA
jgi:hypothetical protein